MASKSALLAAFAVRVIPFEVAGQAFHLRPLTAADMLAVSAYQKTQPDGVTAPMIFVRSVCDENGTRLFEDADVDQVAALIGGPLDKVTAKVLQISALAEDPAGKAPSTTPN